MFRRRTESEVEADVVVEEPRSSPAVAQSKGRPTPKRREAEQRRRRVTKAPKTRKEAAALQRELARGKKEKRRQSRFEGRPLPARDAGPVRAFVRDFVDARRGPGTFFLPVTLLIFALGFSGVPVLALVGNVLLLSLILYIVMNSRALGRAVVAQVDNRFPGEPTRGLRWYATTRSLQLRRMRLPPPRVKVGDPI